MDLTLGGTRNPHRILAVKSFGMQSLEMGKRRWEDNIKGHLKEMGYKDYK
jgi:hypothetical protein